MRIILLLLLLIVSCSYDNEQTYFGCTDPVALNYDSSAFSDDLSCLYDFGCTDVNACNYNPLAITDDESCDYVDNLVFESVDQNDIQQIINNKCKSCHNNIGISLDYQVLTMSDGEILEKFINGNATGYSYQIMPPPGSEPLTNCEKLEILNWIDNDYPLN